VVTLIALASFLYFAIPRISVTGTGTVTAYPDEADIMFSIRSQDTSAIKAASENGAVATAVYSSLAALEVNKSDIRTVSYSLSPTYDAYSYSEVVGYVAVNSIEVIVTGIENLPNVGRIVDAVVKAGANQIEGILFTFTGPNYTTLRTQAYQKAVHNANLQASAIVSGLGGVILGIASVSTNYGYGIPQPLPYPKVTGTKEPTPINSGAQQVTATVSITYFYL